MAAIQAGAGLQERISELRERRAGAVTVSDLAEVIEGLMATVRGELMAADLKLYSEMDALARYIHAAKAEIAALRPDQVKEEYLQVAAGELDAVVAATAEATHAIMDATEAVEGVMDAVDVQTRETLATATTRIYEACGFQDITGQRIGKVVTALKHIEGKVDALTAAFGDEIEKLKAQQLPREEIEDRPLTDEDLLHGPQLAGEAKTQDEIDALLAKSE